MSSKTDPIKRGSRHRLTHRFGSFRVQKQTRSKGDQDRARMRRGGDCGVQKQTRSKGDQDASRIAVAPLERFKNRPDQKGIKTHLFPVLRRYTRSKTDPIKRGSRQVFADEVLFQEAVQKQTRSKGDQDPRRPRTCCGERFKNRPDQKGIKTTRPSSSVSVSVQKQTRSKGDQD